MAKVFDIHPPKSKSTARQAKSFLKPREEKPVDSFSSARSSVAAPPSRRTSSRQSSPYDAFLASLAKKPPRPLPGKQPPSPPSGGGPKFPRFGGSMPTGGVRRFRKLFFYLGGLAIVFFAFYAFGFAISRAEIKLKTAKEFQPVELDITLRPSPTAEERLQGVLPLQKIQKTTTLKKSYPATGEGEALSKAHGKILVYNEFNTEPQILVEKTRFLSPDGKLFRTTQRITVPGGKLVSGKLEPGVVEIEVTADAAGPEYNIEPARFSIPGFQASPRYEKFYGVSKEKFVGGARGKGKIITQEDFRKAQEDTGAAAFDTLKKDLLSSLPETVRVLEQATQIKINKISSNAKPGDAAESFEISLEAGVTALIFDEAEVKEVAAQRLPRQENQELFRPELDISYEILRSDFSAGHLVLHVKGTTNIAKSLDVLALKQTLRGKDSRDVKKQILTLEGVEEAKVSFWPFWIRRIPRQLDRITVQVE
ncbi:MAG: hypothetical protein HYW80_00725 [Parcubacteria group bacterium]|nr:hypothetical protein [Parcubacteria group bacterium]